MSTPNFKTQDNFPLYVYDDGEMEWWEAQDYFGAVKSAMDEQNSGLAFFRITLKSGYYCGVQFYVEMTDAADMAGFTPDGDLYADNESCRYYLDMCYSQARRKFGSEARKVQRLMQKLAEEWFFEKYYCTAIFSNGEAIYAPASNPRARLKAAAIA